MMDINDVFIDLGRGLQTISGLRTHDYWADKVTPPSAVVGWPESYQFDSSYGRGSDRAIFLVTVIVGRSDARISRETLSQYCAGSGEKSIKQKLEAFDSNVWQSIRVMGMTFGVVTIGGIEYIGSTFNVDVIG